MGELAALAELGHLRRELDLGDDDLTFLADFTPDEVRRLRMAVAESLAARHRKTFRSMAAVSKLLPKPILATIGEKAVGPLICSKIAAEIEPGHARKIVGSFSVPFLADLCRTLDTVSAQPVLLAMTKRVAVPVGRELYERGDLDTLARFIDVVDIGLIPPMLEIIDDDALIRIAIVAQSRDRLSEIFELLDDGRLLAVVEAAVRGGVLDQAVVMVSELSGPQVTRTIEVVVGSGDLLITDVVAAVAELDAWDRLLPILAGLDPADVATVASSPVLTRPDVFESIVDHVTAADALDDLVALIGALDDGQQEDLAAALAGSSPAIARRLVDLSTERDLGGDLPAVAVLRRLTDA
ncbi:hypothetical protein [Actinospongicola halichondriae]|uniref:hypothetical protein n=1 Tax=Actinospongicola halichondriae TaxID=3236844 RepID=UPI003D57CC10